MRKTLSPLSLIAFMVLSLLRLEAQDIQTYPAEVTQGRLLGKTLPLSELLQQDHIWHSGSKKKLKSNRPREVRNFQGNTPMPSPFEATALPKDGDPLRFTGVEKNTFEILPNVNVDGMDEDLSGVTPPDPTGDVSPDHYIQMINGTPGSYFQIFDKEGNALTEPVSPNMFWVPFNVTGLGDPIVMWDQGAERWLLTEFGTFGTNVMLIAVSETSDPMGSWNAYEIQAPEFPDYPKYGLWHDAYYITTNEPSDSDIPIYALDRDAMLAGEATVDVQRLGIPKFNAPSAFQVAAPVKWEGSNAPPAGTPYQVVRIYDDAWAGGIDKLEIWEVNIDWDTPSNSSTSGPIEIPLSAFDAELCDGGDIFNCIDQGNGSLISALQQVIMYKVPYRNFGSHETMVLNFSVDVNGMNQAGIRWVELRRPLGGDWTLRQEGTHAPDELHRFMGGINVDGAGNLLLAYSVTGDSRLSLRYSGRLANDPLGELTIDEYEFAAGAGPYGFFRWGDYSAMSVDPSDQSTFWFTGEYMKSSLWGTRIMNTFIRRDTNDVGVQALIQPQNSGYLTDSETVTVAVRNFGYNDQHDIGISMIFDGQPVVDEIITDTIKADSTYLHTFTPTVDLSEIGDYPFVFYTTLATDTAYFNDTLRLVVSQLERNDAGVSEFQNIAFPICDTIAEIGITFINYGVDTLTSANIVYQINSEPEMIIPWTGELLQGESETIMITADVVMEGTNTITARTTMPNGVPDEDASNDEISRTFLIVSEGVTIRLELLTDDYPAETTWEIRDDMGDLIYAGGPYDLPQNLYVEEFCFPDGCFDFTIFDSFGDGIQFNGVEGYYRILNEEGVVLASIQEVNFGTSETNDFCTDFECALILNYLARNESAEGLNDGRILLNANNGEGPYEYSIDGGENFQPSSLFNNLPGGVYEAVIRDQMGCEATTTITIYTCTLTAETEIVDASDLGSADGAVTVTTIGGVPPFMYGLDGETGELQESPEFSDLMAGVYELFVQDSVGCEFEMEIIVGPSTSTDESNFVSGVELIPNPTDGYLRVNVHGLPGLSVLPLRIIDATGKVVLHDRLVAYNDILTNKLNLHGLPNGMYFIQFMDDRADQLVKVIKQD
jgi:hypothetical protein